MFRPYDAIKRLFDVTVSAAALVALAPFLAVVAAWIKMSSPGPVLYAGERVGRGGTTFRMLKFRTMVVDADKRGPSSTAVDDPRVTRIGRVLRRFKLDELPQLINVVRGDMSFVGPRPQVRWAVDLYDDRELQLLTVRPGITDWASIRFHNEGEILRNSTDPDADYLKLIAPEKVRLGLEYVERRSLLTDVGILTQTLKTLLGKGART